MQSVANAIAPLFWQPSKEIYYKEFACIKYTTREFRFKLTVAPGYSINLDWVKVDAKGRVTVQIKTWWDGASGPTIDTIGTIRASFIHDVIYRLIRLGYLPVYVYKDVADMMFYETLIEDGVLQFRAFAWYKAVQVFGHDSCRPESEPQEKRAPIPFSQQVIQSFNNPLIGRPA
jgi:hypothetical protein